MNNQQAKLEQFRREAQQFQSWQDAPKRLAEFEAEIKAEEEEKKLNETIEKLTETLELSLSEFEEDRHESNQKIISALWTLRGLLTDRIFLAEQSQEIANVARHLAYLTLNRDNKMPADIGGQKFVLDGEAEQLVMDRLKQPDAKFMRIASQGDNIIDSILQTIGRFTGDMLVSETNNQNGKPQFVQSQDGVHHIPVKEPV